METLFTWKCLRICTLGEPWDVHVAIAGNPTCGYDAVWESAWSIASSQKFQKAAMQLIVHKDIKMPLFGCLNAVAYSMGISYATDK